MTENFYDLLDVPPNASQDEIKVAFRELVRIYHPDLNDDDRAQAQFTALKTAYDVLGDPVERRAYDRLGHLDYVAKRTSGLPSPEKWATDDSDADEPSRDSSVETETSSWDASTTADDASGTASTAGATTGRRTAAGSGTSWRSRSGSSSRSADARFEPFGRLARWWRSRSVAGPLLWAATVLYLLGLGRYARANGDAITSLWESVWAAGGDFGAIRAAVTSGTRGLDRGIGHVRTAELVTPPLAQSLWLAMLAVAVLAVVGLLLGWRLRSRERPFGPVTIDETVVFAIALGVTSALAGGFLLAGALLLPLLYGIVIYHSRKLSGWSPSYLYLFAVSAPGCALLTGWFEATSVSLELLAFALIPLLGAIGLPIRFAIRRRLGV